MQTTKPLAIRIDGQLFLNANPSGEFPRTPEEQSRPPEKKPVTK